MTRVTSTTVHTPVWVSEFVHGAVPSAIFICSWISAACGIAAPVLGEHVRGGGAALIVRLKGDGPALPTPLVAVTDRLLTAATSGVPLSKPPALKVPHEGTPVAPHPIGDVPLAANWNE